MPAETVDTFDAAFAEVVAAMEAADAAPAAAAPEPTPAPAAVAPESTPAPAAVAPESTPAPIVTAPEPTPAPVAVAPEPTPATAAVAPVPAPAAPVETPEAKAAREAFEASIAPYAPSDDETKAMEQFKKEFPNEAMAIDARLKSVDRDINARIHKAVQQLFQHVEGRLVPVEETVTKSALERHVDALHTAHVDYDTAIAKVPAWIDTLPSYAQVGAKAVFEHGTTQEVIALVADYKKASGAASAPAPTPAPAPAPKAPPPGADDLAPVTSRRSAVVPNGTPDPNDYAGAFAEAVAALDK